jgi:pimeloyl-ACP methyl ester carboxylesterase
MNAALLATWAKLTCPVLLIHGAKSAVLSDQVINKMKEISAALGHPPLEVITIPECGHAPSLMTDEQAHKIEDWLKRTPRSAPGATAAMPRVAEPAHA